MKKWYLIKTKARQEKIAINNLENQKFHVYCPLAKINDEHVILFPGYLFIQLDEKKENWAPIRSTKGVLNFVRFGINFAKIPDNVIEFIRENEKLTLEKLKNIENFKPGETVRITDGVLKNCIGIFKLLKSDDRVILLMNMLGQQQSINVKRNSIIGL
tara:strand:+ start:654 stop:1127 length:474 start_codon:yes stop_codon:yes gene_type:complete